MLNILALSGSLRADSVNSKLLRAAGALAPEGVSLEVYDYSDVPLYNPDKGESEAAERLKAAIRGADALLIATPEYNYSIPGGLKNALDWASRPAYGGPMAGVPTGVMSAAPGMLGGVRAQQHLKLVLLGMAVPLFPYPEFVMSGAFQKFDEEGKLIDEATVPFLERYMEAFAAWATSYPRS